MATVSCLASSKYILCSAEEKNLEQLEGEQIMTELSFLGELSL